MYLYLAAYYGHTLAILLAILRLILVAVILQWEKSFFLTTIQVRKYSSLADEKSMIIYCFPTLIKNISCQWAPWQTLWSNEISFCLILWERKKDNLTLDTKTDQLKATVISNTLNLFLSCSTTCEAKIRELLCQVHYWSILKQRNSAQNYAHWLNMKNEDSVISVNKSLPSFQVFDSWYFFFHSLNTLRKEPIYEEPHNTRVYITNIYYLLHLRWYDFLHRHGKARLLHESWRALGGL